MALESLARGDSPGAKRWLDWAAEALPPHAGLSDPRADPPFRHLLKAVASAGPDRLKLAAAALTAQARDPRPAIAILAAAQANHPSPAETIEIDRALAGAYRAADQPARAIEAADRLLRTSERPKGTVPFSPVRGGQADENRDRPREWQEALCCKMTALADLGRSDELRQLLHTQLQETGNDPRTSELLALEAMRLGDFKSARQRLCGLAGSEKVSPLVFNHRAWLAVAEGNVDQQAIDDALTAAKRTAYENPVCLRTLAAVYAEAGKTAEALENLRRGVRLGGDQARDLDWYVLGRIAEQYGLDDVAAGLFRKVPRPKREAADDAYTLAQRQLKKLGK
jgi:tetratricopeptide (TPR) repeat protein